MENRLMSEDEKQELFKRTRELRNAGMDVEADKLAMLIPIEPSLAKIAKDVYGVDYVKNAGFNLAEAEAQFGKDWLNK